MGLRPLDPVKTNALQVMLAPLASSSSSSTSPIHPYLFDEKHLPESQWIQVPQVELVTVPVKGPDLARICRGVLGLECGMMHRTH